MARLNLQFPESAFCYRTTLTVRITDINAANHLSNDAMISMISEARARFLFDHGISEPADAEAGIIVTDLATMYRAEAHARDQLQASAVQFDAIIGRVLDAVRLAAHKRGVEFRSLVAPLVVHGNAEALEAIASNLLSNALKFSPDNGIVTVTLVQDGGHALLDVVDQGPGIRPDEIDRVFAPFYRGSAAHDVQGSGLGLAIAREFVLAQVPVVIEKFLRDAGVSPREVRHLVPHQPNGVLLDELPGRMGLERAQTHRTVGKYGNVGSASVPVTLDDANREGRFGDGDLVLLAGFGGGMSIGAALMYWRAAS